MAPRSDLQALFEELLESRNVYFQRPESSKMKYPAIVYELDDVKASHADNQPYLLTSRYQVTVIERSPDGPIHWKVARLSTCTFDRHFVADNLHHFVYNLYF